MKSRKLFAITGVIILLLGISLVSGHESDDSREYTRMNASGNRNMMDDGHMNDMLEYMVIEGTISVEDAIIITINVSPRDDTTDKMDEKMGPGDSMHDNFQMSNFKNEITVEFYSLVEFEDDTNDGFSADDEILSSFSLNNETVGLPKLVDDKYAITSITNSIFSMSIDMNFQDDVFFGFKWSVEINYPFTSNTSQLAMLNEINTVNGQMMQQHRMNHGMTGNETHMFNETRMEDNSVQLSMFFSWASTVKVDGSVREVQATGFDDVFALSTPQGQNILYDPTVGVDPTSLFSADDTLKNIFTQINQFWNSVSSPTPLGLILGFSFLITIGAVTYYFTRK